MLGRDQGLIRVMIGSVALVLLALGSISAAQAQSLRGLKFEEEEAVKEAYARTRALLGPDEVSFLEQILAADELIQERQQRGIVDQILATISGAPNPIIGGPTNVQASAPTVGNPKAELNSTCCRDGVAPANANNNGIVSGAGGNDNHLFTQISKVIVNSATRNVTGIVDEALKIGTPQPVRELVNGILGVAYCNGIRRLLGRC